VQEIAQYNPRFVVEDLQNGFNVFKDMLPNSITQEDARDVYDKYVFNNIKFIEKLNGKRYVEMVAANKRADSEGRSKPYILDAESINKRMQPINDGNPVLNDDIFMGTGYDKNDGMRVAILNGSRAVANGVPLGKEVLSDGHTFVRKEYFDIMSDHVGNPLGSGFLKYPR